MNPEELEEILRLARQGMAMRAIARKLGLNPKTIRRVLGTNRPKAPPSKLAPFRDAARELHAKDLFAPRILRELRARGYTGSLTILKDFLRGLGPRKKAPRKVFCRFETKPAVEMQIDWSPYRLKIGGQETVVHCFSMVMCFSRRIWISFFRNERLPTLLHAHVEGFRDHGGICQRLVYDNMTQVTLGRVKGQPLWHPGFLEFAKYYGFEPFAHRVKHKERSGKVERPFFWIETDFLRGLEPSSWEDLQARARVWMDTVANVRKHSTTHRLVHEAYAEEKPFLIALPETAFPTDRRETRKVQKDGYIPVDGSFYPVPDHLVGQWVTVRIYPLRVEVVDASGKLVVGHPVPERPSRIPPAWGPAVTPAASATRTQLEAAFLVRFPGAADFLDGLKMRMNALSPIHLRQIERLAALYGDAPVAAAIERARTYRNFNAEALKRILEAAHPNVVAEPPVTPLTAGPEILGALDDVEPASPRDYTLDSMPPTEDKNDGPKE